MNIDQPRTLLQQDLFRDLLDGMVLIPFHARDGARPRADTHLTLTLRMHFREEAYKQAGLDVKVLVQQSATPHIYVPLTPELKRVIEATGIYSPATADAYYLEYDSGGLSLRYQQILGSRFLTPHSSELDHVVQEKLVERLLSHRDITDPFLRFAADERSNRHGIIVQPSNARVSARLVDKADTQAKIRLRYSELSAPPHQNPKPRPLEQTGSPELDVLGAQINEHMRKATAVLDRVASSVGVPHTSVHPVKRPLVESSRGGAGGATLQELSRLKIDPSAQQHLLLPKEHLAHYAAIKSLVTKAGGKYNSKGYFAFPEGIDVAMVLRSLQAGAVVNEKKDFQFFATARETALQLCDNAGSLDGKRVLEPSAGDGALADIARDRGANVTTVENWPVNVLRLREKGYEVMDRDFLGLEPAETGLFDVILANPPFSKNQDIDHVLHMMKFLEPGGVLSAIVSQGWQREGQKKHRDFAEFLRELDAEIVPIEAGAFKESGTSVGALQIRVVKPELDLSLHETKAPRGARAGM